MHAKFYSLKSSLRQKSRIVTIFTKHDQVTSCYNSDDCLRSLKLATAQSPMTMTMRNYRQIAIAMSKRHIPGLLKQFNPHLPNDLDGFLSLLSFQTGHKPATRSGAYALENGFPSKLQPDLIHRYLENSGIWQKFVMISKDDYLEWEPLSRLVRAICDQQTFLGSCPPHNATRQGWTKRGRSCARCTPKSSR